MNKSQLNAISYAYSAKAWYTKLKFIKETNRYDDYEKSKYKSPSTYVQFRKIRSEYVNWCLDNNFKIY